MSKRSVSEAVSKLKGIIDGNEIDAEVKQKLSKQVNQISKHIKPAGPKEKKAGPSEFSKQYPISDEMAEFAGWDKGVLKSRIEITKAIWTYVKNKELQLVNNKRKFNLDDTLKQILIAEPQLSYPTIQKYIGKHHKKNAESQSQAPV